MLFEDKHMKLGQLGIKKYKRSEIFSTEEVNAMLESALKMKLWELSLMIALASIFGKRIVEIVRLRLHDIEIKRSTIEVTFSVAKKPRKIWNTDYGLKATKSVTLKHPYAKLICKYLEILGRRETEWNKQPINNGWICKSCDAVQHYGITQISRFADKPETPISEINPYIAKEHPTCWKCGKILLKIQYNPWLFPDERQEKKEQKIIHRKYNKDGIVVSQKEYKYVKEAGHITTDHARYLLKKVQPDAFWHNFRRTKATGFATRGTTEYKLMAYFDWTDPKIAASYVQASGVNIKDMQNVKWIT
jgi:hypothetical protein